MGEEKNQNIDIEQIETKLKGVVAKGTEVSKNAIDKAGNALQIFSDKSILKIERSQINSRREKVYLELGRVFSSALTEKYISLTANEDALSQESMNQIEKLQSEIEEFTKQIQEKTELLNSYKK